MNWQEVAITSDINLAESLSDFLINLTGRGISLEDIPDPSNPALPPTQRIKAYFRLDKTHEDKITSLHQYLEYLKELFPDSKSISVTSETIAEENWAHAWQDSFKPLRLTERIVVKPSWENFAGRTGDIVLEIDPKMAFGTGSHPSTYLCLRALEDIITTNTFCKKNPEIKVLDVGTGTGILGMAAAKLGACRVTGIDIDPEAITAALVNIQKNGLQDKMTVSNQSLAEVTEKFHLILANIMYLELIKLCPLLSQRSHKEGILILSGIISEQAKGLLDEYQGQGFKPLSMSKEEEWVCVVLTKRA